MDDTDGEALVRRAAFAALALAAIACGACRHQETPYERAHRLTGGDPGKGMADIDKYGCGGCHMIPGVEGANATVGPSLASIAGRPTLAGQLPNTPDNMRKWIQKPQSVNPKTVMPDMGVTDADARDISAYLYTLK
jgi:cytochrome c2